MAVVLKLVDARGTLIKGESKVAGHVDEIDVLAWSWGVTAPVGAKFDILDMSIRKSFDLASPKILAATAAHEVLQLGVLTVIDDQNRDLLVVTMKKILVESVSIAEEPKEYPVAENVALRFDEIELSYRGEKVVVRRGGPAIARRKR
jgi:type VI secretion system secreted protein Hcp